jgi:hypothetical protein
LSVIKIREPRSCTAEGFTSMGVSVNPACSIQEHTNSSLKEICLRRMRPREPES